jgi:hypothetical protein
MNVLIKKLYNIFLKILIVDLTILIKFVGFIFETKIGHFCFIMLFGSIIIFLMSAVIDINPSEYIVCLAIPAIFLAMIDDR